VKSLRFAAVLSALTLVAFLSLASTARSDEVIVFDHDTYAAIAYSPSTGSYGYAYNCDSRGEAERLALKHCKARDARIATWVHNGFCALAVGDDQSCWGSGWSYGDGATNREAKRYALDECRKRTTGAHIILCVCSADVEPEKP
jgi:hypothetical protein